MDIPENDFVLNQPRKRRISEAEFKKAEEALEGWRGLTVGLAVLLAILSSVFCYGAFMHDTAKLCTLGPMIVIAGLIYWINNRCNQLGKLVMDYEAQQ